MTEKYLDILEDRINEEVEEDLLLQWNDFYENRLEGDFFLPRRKAKALPVEGWPEIHINDALEDYDKMLLSQLSQCVKSLVTGDGAPLSARCNYGVAILPSLFGVELYVMDRKFNTLPTSIPLKGGANAIRELAKKGVPDIYGGLGRKVFEMGQHYRKVISKYPKISKYVHIYHPDTQGPMDICELIWGSNIFLDIMDEPQLVHEFLNIITETYIKFLKEWFALFPPKKGLNVHWQLMHKGSIMLRDDSAMNFSPALFDEFIKPYDQRLLDEFGGGVIHFCGRGDHYIQSMTEMRGLFAINLSQPQYNDMEVIYRNTVDKGIYIIGLKMDEGMRAINSGRDLKSRVHCP